MLFPAFQPQTTGQIKKVTSSEGSATQIYRGTPRSVARSRRACPERRRRNPGDAYLAHAVRTFLTTEAREQDLPSYTLDGHGHILSCTVIIFHPQVCARSLNSGLIVRMTRRYRLLVTPM